MNIIIALFIVNYFGRYVMAVHTSTILSLRTNQEWEIEELGQLPPMVN